MTRSKTLLSLVALLACVVAASASAAETPVPRGKYLLRYNFAMGESLRYEVKQSTSLRTTMENTTQRNSSQTESVKLWKVTDVLPSGDMEFIHLVESVKMSNEGSSQPKRSFDSTSKEPPAQGFEAASRAVGVPLVVVRLSPSGKVISREQKLPQAETPTEDLPITLELPEQPVGLGERWSHSYDVAVKKASGADFKIRTRRVCRLQQVKDGIATIEVEYQILTPVDATIRAQIVERLTKGAVRFDLKRGRVIQQSHTVDRREIGFAASNKASSMHFVARTSERLLSAAATPAAVAVQPAAVQPAAATQGAVAEVIPASAESR